MKLIVRSIWSYHRLNAVHNVVNVLSDRAAGCHCVFDLCTSSSTCSTRAAVFTSHMQPTCLPTLLLARQYVARGPRSGLPTYSFIID